MSDLVADCPRCGATKITFDLYADVVVGRRYDWQRWYEAFCVCRHCGKGTIFVLAQRGIDEQKLIKKVGLPKVPGAVNDLVTVDRFITAHDKPTISPPEHLPENILAAFNEGAICLSVNCFNAAGTMFRLCVDHATFGLLPTEDSDGLTQRIRRSLGLRLVWLFDSGRLPESLRELSHCVKEDGNDGAHAGTLSKADAEDLLDFTNVLLERIFTEPKRLEAAREHRAARRGAA